MKEILRVELDDEQVLEIYKIEENQLAELAQYAPDLQKGNLKNAEFVKWASETDIENVLIDEPIAIQFFCRVRLAYKCDDRTRVIH